MPTTGQLGRLGSGASELVASGLRSGIHHREIFRELFGKGDDVVGVYHPRVGLRRVEDGTGIGGGTRAGGSFVAYVGGDVNLHAGARGEAAVGSRGGGVTVVGSVARRWEQREVETLEDEIWSAAATSGGGRGLKEGHGKEEGACMDLVPLEQSKPRSDSQKNRDDDGERHELRLHQSGDTTTGPQGSASTNCRDCGNQAKKDCQHQRCRTCCRSHGFTCPTHVKSTWVPAVKRREKQALSVAACALRTQPKRSRSGMAETDVATGAISLSPTSAGTSPRDSEINSANPSQLALRCCASAGIHDECYTANFRGKLPAEVRAQAVFKCVRVTGIEDEHGELAYQTTVKIGGHIFKGILYDQGPDNVMAVMNVTELHLGGKTMPSTSALINPAAGVLGSWVEPF